MVGVRRISVVAKSPCVKFARILLLRQSCLEIKPCQYTTKLSFAVALVLGLGIGQAVVQDAAIAQDLAPQIIAQVPNTSAIAINLLFVDPTIGNDSHNGSQRSPFRTITHALQVAQTNTVILLSPGTYSTDSGETFPLALNPGVTLQGNPGTRGRGILIRGGGDFLSPTAARQNVAILGNHQAGLNGVTVTNPNPRGYGLWIESSSLTVTSNTFTNNTHDGISVNGNSAPVIQDNWFTTNGANGITVFGTSQPHIQSNIFENTGFGINVAQNAAPIIVSNRIVGNRNGVVVQGNARPILRHNLLENNREAGVAVVSQALPDLGTAAEPGNNQFRNNGQQDINATASRQSISAVGNVVSRDRVTGTVDVSGSNVPQTETTVAVVPAPQRNTPFNSTLQTPNAPTPQVQPINPAPIAVQSVNPAASNSTSAFSSLPRLQPAPSISIPPTQNLGQPPANVNPVGQPTPTGNQTRAYSSSSQNPEAAFPHPNNTPAQELLLSVPRVNFASRSHPEVSLQPQTPTATQILVSPPAAPDRAIEILVPPASSNRQPPTPTAPQTTVRSPQPITQPAPITVPSQAVVEIPVPPPESNTVAPTAIASSQLSSPQTLSPVNRANLLPVPDANVPIGNIGSLPTISVSRSPWLNSRGGGNPPAASSNLAAALGLRYRVLVEAPSERVQNQVRSLIPGAFRTSVNGRVMMQAGAYNSRENADETIQLLNSNGFQATVQQIE
jgi:parallel beta-helix repeat protein